LQLFWIYTQKWDFWVIWDLTPFGTDIIFKKIEGGWEGKREEKRKRKGETEGDKC